MTRHIKIQREYEVFYVATWVVTESKMIQADSEEHAEEIFEEMVQVNDFSQVFIENKPPYSPEIEIDHIEVQGGLA